MPVIAIAFIADSLGFSPTLSAGLFGLFWYGGEMLLAAVAKWHLSPLAPFYGLARDLLVPVLFVRALRSNDFVWRGNEMQVERMRPRAAIARMRPHLHDLARGSQRRLRAIRERVASI